MQLIQQDLMKQEADVPIVRKDHKVWLEHFNEFMDIYQYQSASEALTDDVRNVNESRLMDLRNFKSVAESYFLRSQQPQKVIGDSTSP